MNSNIFGQSQKSLLGEPVQKRTTFSLLPVNGEIISSAPATNGAVPPPIYSGFGQGNLTQPQTTTTQPGTTMANLFAPQITTSAPLISGSASTPAYIFGSGVETTTNSLSNFSSMNSNIFGQSQKSLLGEPVQKRTTFSLLPANGEIISSAPATNGAVPPPIFSGFDFNSSMLPQTNSQPGTNLFAHQPESTGGRSSGPSRRILHAKRNRR